MFVGPQSVMNTGDWIDRPSVGIPYLYVATGIELAEALKSQGKTQQAADVFNTSKQIATTVRLEELRAPGRGGVPAAADQRHGQGRSAPGSSRARTGEDRQHEHPRREVGGAADQDSAHEEGREVEVARYQRSAIPTLNVVNEKRRVPPPRNAPLAAGTV